MINKQPEFIKLLLGAHGSPDRPDLSPGDLMGFFHPIAQKGPGVPGIDNIDNTEPFGRSKRGGKLLVVFLQFCQTGLRIFS